MTGYDDAAAPASAPRSRPRAEPSERFTAAERTAMRTALEAAQRGIRGANPVVGAAILSAAGEILHVGHHRGAGTAHAEADALRLAHEAGTPLEDTTMVVTLEPCNHTGRTGPCSRAILEAGIPRVIYAVADGTDAARGGGAFLAAHGVDVRHGLLAPEARDLNDRWFAAQDAARPFVTLKLAQTIDGRVAAADGTSQWITAALARAEGHALRERVDAILVGGGTLRADDPTLTARDAAGEPLARQPLRAVMSTRAVPGDAKVRRGVVGQAPERDSVYGAPKATGEGQSADRADAATAEGGSDGQFVHLTTHDPAEALHTLKDRGVSHVLVEGGPTVSAALLAADLVDELWLYQAPLILGDGAASVGSLGIETLAAASSWRSDPVRHPADLAAPGPGESADAAMHAPDEPADLTHPGDGVTADRVSAITGVGADVRWHLRPASPTSEAP